MIAIFPVTWPDFQMAHRRGHLVQRVRPIDAGDHRACGDVGRENLAVGGPLFGGQAGEPLRDEPSQDHCSQLPTDTAGQFASAFTPDDDGRSGRGERPPEPGERGVASDVDDQVVPGAVGEVFTGVVDYLVSAEIFHQVEFVGAAYPGDLRAECLGQLHGETSDTAGRAGDQHPLPCLHPPGFQGLPRGAPGDSEDRGVLERATRRFVDQLVLAGRGVLGEGTTAHAEHFVAGGESGHRRADRDHGAGDIDAGYPVLRPTEPVPDDPHQVRGAGHQVPGAPIQTCRTDLQQHLHVGNPW